MKPYVDIDNFFLGTHFLYNYSMHTIISCVKLSRKLLRFGKKFCWLFMQQDCFLVYYSIFMQGQKSSTHLRLYQILLQKLIGWQTFLHNHVFCIQFWQSRRLFDNLEIIELRYSFNNWNYNGAGKHNSSVFYFISYPSLSTNKTSHQTNTTSRMSMQD